MKVKLLVAAMSLVSGIGMLAYAEEPSHKMAMIHSGDAKVISISVDKDDNDPAQIKLKINGEELSFAMPELEDGEVREFTTNEGKVVKLIKAKMGSTLVIDGQEIQLHDFGAGMEHGKMAKIFALKGMGGMHHGMGEMHHAMGDDNSIVISGGNLDEDTRERIKQAIMDTGVDKTVKFMGLNSWTSKDGGNFEIIIDSENDGEVATEGLHIIKIEKHIELHTEDDDG